MRKRRKLIGIIALISILMFVIVPAQADLIRDLLTLPISEENLPLWERRYEGYKEGTPQYYWNQLYQERWKEIYNNYLFVKEHDVITLEVEKQFCESEKEVIEEIASQEIYWMKLKENWGVSGITMKSIFSLVDKNLSKERRADAIFLSPTLLFRILLSSIIKQEKIQDKIQNIVKREREKAIQVVSQLTEQQREGKPLTDEEKKEYLTKLEPYIVGKTIYEEVLSKSDSFLNFQNTAEVAQDCLFFIVRLRPVAAYGGPVPKWSLSFLNGSKMETIKPIYLAERERKTPVVGKSTSLADRLKLLGDQTEKFYYLCFRFPETLDFSTSKVQLIMATDKGIEIIFPLELIKG